MGSTWHIFTTISLGSFQGICLLNNPRKGWLSFLSQVRTDKHRIIWGQDSTKPTLKYPNDGFLHAMTRIRNMTWQRAPHRGLKVQIMAPHTPPRSRWKAAGEMQPQHSNWNVAAGLFLDLAVTQLMLCALGSGTQQLNHPSRQLAGQECSHELTVRSQEGTHHRSPWGPSDQRLKEKKLRNAFLPTAGEGKNSGFEE